MKWQRIEDGGEKTYVLVFDEGDEVGSLLADFARRQKLSAGQFTAIGAFRDVKVGYLDWQTKKYKEIDINEQVEVLALTGDVAVYQGEPKVHAHVVVGKSDGTAHGGHLLAAHVRPTLEVILRDAPRGLRKRYDPATGLTLIDIDESQSVYS
ncbi:MAG: DNA-binding protein [Acidobacteria bacterium]|nr:DNA-binding protein [Acidobacteriota bacterium]MBI3278832.1 DNA-binding protein [Acidobacteriota bacterium]